MLRSQLWIANVNLTESKGLQIKMARILHTRGIDRCLLFIDTSNNSVRQSNNVEAHVVKVNLIASSTSFVTRNVRKSAKCTPGL